jgi:hypothetical protein
MGYTEMTMLRLTDSNAGLQAGSPWGPQAGGFVLLRVFDVNSTRQSVVMVSR